MLKSLGGKKLVLICLEIKKSRVWKKKKITKNWGMNMILPVFKVDDATDFNNCR